MLVLDDLELYKSILEKLPVGLYLVDTEERIRFWNEGAERITGYLSQEVLGKKCTDPFLTQEEQESKESGLVPPFPLLGAMRDGKTVRAQVSMRHRDGHPILVWLKAVPLRGADGHIIGAVKYFEPPGQAPPSNRRGNKLEEFGCLDIETVAVNHKYAETQLREHLETFVVHRLPFSVLAIQVDQLDALRAKQGAEAMHAVHRAVAETVANSLRPTDLLGRWGETEFLVVAAECNRKEVVGVAERLLKLIHRVEVEWWGDLLRVTASIGASSAQDLDTSESLVQRADEALRECVRQGGNRFVVNQG